MSNAVVFAYCSDAKEVLWFFDDEEDDVGLPKRHTPYGRMARWLTNGHEFTILEYLPNGPESYSKSLSDRAVWWDKQLRDQGYPIYDLY